MVSIGTFDLKSVGLVVTLIVSLFVGGLTPATALELYACGSYWDGEDSDGVMGAGLGASIPLLIDHLRLDGRAYFFDKAEFDRSDRLELAPIDLGLQLHLFPDGTWDPYVLGGVSFIYADAREAPSDYAWGSYGGVGLELRWLEHLPIFAEFMYRSADVDLDWFHYDSVDVSGWNANFGLKIQF